MVFSPHNQLHYSYTPINQGKYTERGVTDQEVTISNIVQWYPSEKMFQSKLSTAWLDHPNST